MAWKISIDKEKCIGCGACEANCPELFELKDGKAHARKGKIEEPGCVKDAEEGCPVEAIKVSEA